VLHQLVDEGRVTPEELRSGIVCAVQPDVEASGFGRRSTDSVAVRRASHTARSCSPRSCTVEAYRSNARLGLVRGPGGRLARIDLAVPEIRWGIELDLYPEHRSIEGHAGDARRYRDLHLVEWQIEPVSEIDCSTPQ